jgi:DNA-binding CsgD family transcriptional regulator
MTFTKTDNMAGYICVIRDITERKLAEEELREHRNRLEKLVKERTRNLQQANTALKVLLKRREEDKAELEEKMVLNVKELILPYLNELKETSLKNDQSSFVDIISYNLNDIISPFVKKLSSSHRSLTPTEIRIANLIKQGKSTKDIAKYLRMSPRTIDNHRYHIRKKLGLGNKKANLTSYLLSVS